MERGWPVFERSIACLTKSSRLVVDLWNFDDGCSDHEMMLKRCGVSRTAPLTPEAFCARLARTTFTNGADFGFVVKKYSETFEESMSSVRNLSFTGLDWDDSQASRLSAALAWCPVLENLDLSSNAIQQCEALASALTSLSTLEVLHLNENRIADTVVEALAGVLSRLPALRSLELRNNQIGDSGAEAIAAALSHAPTLNYLHLGGNRIGHAAAQQLRKAWCGRPADRLLVGLSGSQGRMAASMAARALLNGIRSGEVSRIIGTAEAKEALKDNL